MIYCVQQVGKRSDNLVKAIVALLVVIVDECTAAFTPQGAYGGEYNVGIADIQFFYIIGLWCKKARKNHT